MKRILVVLMLLSVVAGAYAVSGKIYARFNKQGPVFEYWAGGGNNVDLWQQKDGTGFDIGFDSFGLTYRTRPALAIPWGLETGTTTVTPPTTNIAFQAISNTAAGPVYGLVTNVVAGSSSTSYGAFDENGWGRQLMATSPGYFRLKDIKFGNFMMQVGFSWTQAFATAAMFSTNTNAATTTNDTMSQRITFNKFYVDYKFDLPLGDMIVVKQYDWDLMHFEYSMGDLTTGSSASGTFTNTPISGTAFLAYVPLNILLNLNAVNITLSPKYMIDTSTLITSGATSTNTVLSSKMKVGGYARISLPVLEMLSIYVMGGAFYTTTEDFTKTLGLGGLVTNSRSTSASIATPIFAGAVIKMGPGIKMTLGWGIQYTSTGTIVDTAGTNGPTTTQTSLFNQYGSFDNNVKAEFATYGDNFMDLAFLRFGSDAKFAGNWSVGIAGGVALNDEWTFGWLNKGEKGTTVSGIGTGLVTTTTANQLFSFINFMNYDRQMYIKYEDENVAIKGTIAQEGNFNGAAGAYQTSLFGMFEYVDLTIKF